MARLRIILILLIATLGLGGCALAVRALVGAGARSMIRPVGAGSLTTSAGTGAVAASRSLVPVQVTSRLSGFAQQRGLLSSSLNEITAGGRQTARVNLERSTGRLTGHGHDLGRLDVATGDIVANNGARIGYLRDGRLFEVLDSGGSRPIAALRGFVRSRGVKLYAADGVTTVSILRSNVVFEVLELRGDYYLVRLIDGRTTGLLSASAGATLLILAGDQELSECEDGRAGQAIRRSGEAIDFVRCEQGGGVLDLTTPNGRVVVDRYDVQRIVSGGPSELIEERIAEQPGPKRANATAFAYAVMQAERPSDWIEREARLWPEEAARMAPADRSLAVGEAPQFGDRSRERIGREFAREDARDRRLERRLERREQRREERGERGWDRDRFDTDRQRLRDRRRLDGDPDRAVRERRRQERAERVDDLSRERRLDRRRTYDARSFPTGPTELRRQPYADRPSDFRDRQDRSRYDRAERRNFQRDQGRDYRPRVSRERRGGYERRRPPRRER